MVYEGIKYEKKIMEYQPKFMCKSVQRMYY